MNTPVKKRYGGKHDAALKIAIAREYLTTDQGYGTLAKKYNIAEGTIPSLIRWYQQRYPDGTIPQQQDTTTPPAAAAAISHDPKDLQQAQLKIEALELLIEHAGKELGVDLVKKFGTKQSKR